MELVHVHPMLITEDDGVLNANFVKCVGTEDLPDELLLNIFYRTSPYSDLDSSKAVSSRWNRIVKYAIEELKTWFIQSVLNGNLKCIMLTVPPASIRTPPLSRQNGISLSWPQERFGQMSAYFNKSLYIIGGSTHRNTTFNDMWKFDLGSHTWSRVISRGAYPSPKAFASCVQYKDNFFLFGGWTHPSPSPLMAPWRLFEEFHRYNITQNSWSFIVGTVSPPPTAGHSCSVNGDEMIVFGGRIYDVENQRYPLSNDVWIYDLIEEDWYLVETEGTKPLPRYGHTQISLSDSNILIVGGCESPAKLFHDIWLFSYKIDSRKRRIGRWKQVNVNVDSALPPSEFLYSGVRIGDNIMFFAQQSSLSPYLSFLHFDAYNLPILYQHGPLFQSSREPFSRRPLSLSSSFPILNSVPVGNSIVTGSENTYPTMPLYTIDISTVLLNNCVQWKRENSSSLFRPEERFLYSVIVGRSEIILFGGFFKDPNPNGIFCRISNDIFILKAIPVNY